MARPKYPRRPSAPHHKSSSYYSTRSENEVTPLVRRRSEYENHVAWRKTKIGGAALGVAFMVLIALGIFFWDRIWWERKHGEGEGSTGEISTLVGRLLEKL